MGAYFALILLRQLCFWAKCIYAELISLESSLEEIYMDSMLITPSNPSRSIVYGLLVNCLFPKNKQNCADCPLKELRSNLSIEKKHEFAMGFRDEELEKFLEHHKDCYDKRLSELNLW